MRADNIYFTLLVLPALESHVIIHALYTITFYAYFVYIYMHGKTYQKRVSVQTYTYYYTWSNIRI